MGELVYEQSHTKRLNETLLSQFWGKPNIRSIVETFGEAIQSFEDVSYDLSVSAAVDMASGHLLDRLGGWIGEQRGDATDEDYRRYIRARIAAQRSNGTARDIGNVISLLSPESRVDYFTAYPAGYRFVLTHADPLTESQIRRFGRILELARPAGVEASFVESVTPDDEIFRFGSQLANFGGRFSRRII